MLLKTLLYLLPVLLLLASAPAQEAPPEPVVRGLLEHPVQDEVLYFLIPDRFFDGDLENNCGDYEGPCVPEASREEVLSHGYLPSDKGYYHGGDIAGLLQKLDYLESMGVTAIWVGPIFENKPVQEDATNLYGHSSGYHGYWITDFMRVDPHLGGNEAFAALVEAAHARGIKVFMDIITNHTADVIQYEEGEYGYRNKAQYPYLDVHGEPFDDADYAYRGQEDYAFPEMDTDGFPYTPFVPEGEQGVKNPEWLNDLTLYHNRGNSTFSGENSLYGDFFGLDDLFTERKEVVAGMIEIYRFWIETFNVDGFRIDTTKHVNIEFWQAFGPAILEAAREAGISHFFAFGEVYDQRPPFLSYFSTTGELQATIDFAFQEAARGFASRSQATDALRDLFALDDYYTHAGGNAYAMPTFVGNHDMGRIGFFLQQDQPGASDEELLRRSALAHALMYFARGQPVVYYGDEQGFTGDGGDKDARQDMFPSGVPSYNDDALIGTGATTAEDNFDLTHPLYRTLKHYAEVYAAHPALRRGAQIHRYSSDSAGIYAFSRIDRDDRVEYVVALNNDPAASHTAAVPTYYGEGVTFERILGDAETPESLTTTGARLELTVPPLGTVIYRAGAAFESEAVLGAPGIAITSPQDNQSVALGVNNWDGHEVLERLEVVAQVTTESYAEVSFAVSVDGGDYRYIGTDANPPYRVLYDATGLPEGASLAFMASVSNLSGRVSSATVSGITVVSQEAGPPTRRYPYAVIHYHRPEGDYGALGADDTWGVHTWGEALAPDQGQDLWEAPIPFVGESDFGRFAYFRLADSGTPFNFIIHTPGGDEVPKTREPGGDRSFVPDEHPEVWIVQGDETVYTSQAEAQGYITVHYAREDADYEGVTLDASADNEPLATGVRPEGTDAYGAVFTLSRADYETLDFSRPLSLTVNAGSVTDVSVTFIPAEGMASVYLQQGDATAYRSRAAAENVAVLHYRRDDGDYGDYSSPDFDDFWGVHVWTGAANATEWQEPIRASGEDAFGVFFTVPLEPGAGELAYIIHRGDAKDPGPDQFLDLSAHGHEVWQASGADPEHPYVLPVPREGAGYGEE